MNILTFTFSFFLAMSVYAKGNTQQDTFRLHQKAAKAEVRRAGNPKQIDILKLLAEKSLTQKTTQNCTIGGGHCDFDSDCCSDNCDSGKCQAGVGGCTVGGGSCDFSSDCCSNSCYSGTCQEGNGSCLGGGTHCSFDSDCCSDNCYSGTCQATCGSTDDSCTYDHDCCGGNCNRLGRCGAEPSPGDNCR